MSLTTFYGGYTMTLAEALGYGFEMALGCYVDS